MQTSPNICTESDHITRILRYLRGYQYNVKYRLRIHLYSLKNLNYFNRPLTRLYNSSWLHDPIIIFRPFLKVTNRPLLPLTLYAFPFLPYRIPHPPYSLIGLYVTASTLNISSKLRGIHFRWKGLNFIYTPVSLTSVSKPVVYINKGSPIPYTTAKASNTKAITASPTIGLFVSSAIITHTSEIGPGVINNHTNQ